jgi:hypothetical protein
MGNTWGVKLLIFSSLLLLASGALAQYGTQLSPRFMPGSAVDGSNLVPYLQAELNGIALLTAQSNYLMQQGDTVGSVLVSSYIPDHQMQASMLAQEIRNRGGDPDTVQANLSTPYLGTRAQILAYDSQQYVQAATSYRRLTKAGTEDSRMLGMSGLSNAERHFASLQVAHGATIGGPIAVLNGLNYALQLERTAILDIQTQASQLNRMNDPATANRLLSLIPAHQAQAATLESLITRMGGNPAAVQTATVALLPTRDAIMAHFRSADIQIANTYATQIAGFSSASPIYVASLQGQRNALTAIAVLFGTVVPTV